MAVVATKKIVVDQHGNHLLDEERVPFRSLDDTRRHVLRDV
jgi:hypothetical protein